MADPIIVVDGVGLYKNKLVLVQRMWEPLGLACPGGKVDPGESLEEAVVREIKEETNLEAKIIKKLGLYDTPGRDPRGDYRSTVFICEYSGEPRHQEDEVKELVFMDLSDVDKYKDQFAGDHYQIVKDYINSL